MSVDYDVRRDVEAVKEEQEQLVRTLVAVPAQRPADETELLSDLELPGADLSDEILSVAVLPQQADEFRCTRCYLVLHQRLRVGDGVCRDCA